MMNPVFGCFVGVSLSKRKQNALLGPEYVFKIQVVIDRSSFPMENGHPSIVLSRSCNFEQREGGQEWIILSQISAASNTSKQSGNKQDGEVSRGLVAAALLANW